jgi:hypothetical protein
MYCLCYCNKKCATVTQQKVVVVVPPAILPAAAVFQAAPLVEVIEDPRDATIAMLKTSLLSLQSTLEKMQSSTTAASMQHQPPAPVYSVEYSQNKAPQNQYVALRPETNRWTTDQSAVSRFPGCFNSESDGFSNFYFRMQQHSHQSQQFTMQNTVERLEFENYLQRRELAHSNAQQLHWRS